MSSVAIIAHVSRVTQVVLLDTRNTMNSWSKILRFSSCGELASRQFHLTRLNFKENRSKQTKQKVKNKEHTSRPDKMRVTEEMKTATRDVAKSLGGNWTKTAEELLARLVSLQEPPSPVSSESSSTDVNDTKSAYDVNDTKSGSLLTTMHVGKGIDLERKDRRSQRDSRKANFTNLFGGTRLGIFDAESVKAAVLKSQEHQSLGEEKGDLWQEVEQERLRKMMGAVPQNAFEEMANWTRQGKMWKFPVDNEEDMHEEKQVKFHEHIFLDKHLGEFPDQGPIRKFMELVVIGLGSNPWLTVQEKIGHIEWYAEYFREKEDTLVASIGEQGKMKAKSTETTDAQ